MAGKYFFVWNWCWIRRWKPISKNALVLLAYQVFASVKESQINIRVNVKSVKLVLALWKSKSQINDFVKPSGAAFSSVEKNRNDDVPK